MTSHTFDTPGGVALTVGIRSGHVRVAVHDQPTTDVDVVLGSGVAPEQLRVQHSEFGGEHHVAVELVTGRSGFGIGLLRHSDIDVTVRVPAGSRAEISTASAPIVLTGAYRQLEVKTASGDAQVDTVETDLSAQASSGSITVTSCMGRATIRTASGDVRCGHLGENASIATASGDVEVASGIALTVTTASGDIRAAAAGECRFRSASGDQHVERLDAGSSGFTSVSGDVTVAVARGGAVHLDAESISGELVSEIELGDQPDGAEPTAGPVIELKIRTVSGDVRVSRSRSSDPSTALAETGSPAPVADEPAIATPGGREPRGLLRRRPHA